MKRIDGLGPHAQSAVDVSIPHPTVTAMQNRNPRQIFDNAGLALVSKTYNHKNRPEVVKRCNECEVNVQPFVMGTYGELEPRSLKLIKCVAAAGSVNGYWKDKFTGLTRHILTAITLNLFRAKAIMLIRVMRETCQNQFLSFRPDVGLIEAVFNQSKLMITETKLNEPFLLLRLPAMVIPNGYIL